MKNILSYNTGAIFTGQEINDWCRENLEKGGARSREAARLLKKGYENKEKYILRVVVKNDEGRKHIFEPLKEYP